MRPGISCNVNNTVVTDFLSITIYMIAFTMAFILYFFNRKLSWMWFKGIGTHNRNKVEMRDNG